MVELLQSLGLSEEQARDFLSVISTDLVHESGYPDLQYRPALRIAQSLDPSRNALTPPEIIHLPAIICTSNVQRNVQSANKFRVELNAQVFVENASRTLRSRFENVETNRPVKGKDGATDIDLIILDTSTLYLFECKHSLPPTGPHEIRDIWEEIEQGIHQLEKATAILSDANRRQSYVTGWFPGTQPREPQGLKIVACVLCSHRIFSGLQHKGFPIRDFSSLARLCDDGIIGMGGAVDRDEVVLRQHRVIRGNAMSGPDLADYCSADSTYFKTFRPFMHLVSRVERLQKVTLAKETFGYEVELDDWSRHMEALGCAREPDRRQKLSPDRSVEALTEDEMP